MIFSIFSDVSVDGTYISYILLQTCFTNDRQLQKMFTLREFTIQF